MSHDDEVYNVVRFDGVELTFRASDGFVNATKLCQLGGREWKTYVRSHQAFLDAVRMSVHRPCKVHFYW